MRAINQSELAGLVRETRAYLELAQTKCAAKPRVSFQSVHGWENGRTKPLPVALKHIEQRLHEISDFSKDWLTKYFSE